MEGSEVPKRLLGTIRERRISRWVRLSRFGVPAGCAEYSRHGRPLDRRPCIGFGQRRWFSERACPRPEPRPRPKRSTTPSDVPKRQRSIGHLAYARASRRQAFGRVDQQLISIALRGVSAGEAGTMTLWTADLKLTQQVPPTQGPDEPKNSSAVPRSPDRATHRSLTYPIPAQNSTSTRSTSGRWRRHRSM